MKRIFFAFLLLFLNRMVFAQKDALTRAFQKFENDSQLKAAISSLYVINAKTGAVIFEKNVGIGLAPASTQKLITAASAYEMLGREFQYKTEFGIVLEGPEANLYIKPSGDPTLGSWRWKETKEEQVLWRILKQYKKELKSFSKLFIINDGWNFEAIPDGWGWQDIGNYYGAGAFALNWRENQFDVILRSGKNLGEPVDIINTEPKLYSYTLSSRVISAKDTSDNTDIYFPLNGYNGRMRGTIPANRNRFVVSGAFPDPQSQFVYTIFDSLQILKKDSPYILFSTLADLKGTSKIIHTETSPPLDSIIYCLNKKSVNLYAEALLKSIALNQANMAFTKKGTQIIKRFWKTKGIDTAELNMHDGSGLSPSNRITTRAEVKILQYAKKQSWFQGFYHSLPEYNGMKMKSGTIRDVKGFAGYHTSKKGIEYVFSFLVNNYNGSATTLVKKMYTVLDELK
jgi:D-alanyl-D-alanine carboxypeptidase/D-alanyl-D-alanine-endopeptidase (penicillin-binding protein 4)